MHTTVCCCRHTTVHCSRHTISASTSISPCVVPSVPLVLSSAYPCVLSPGQCHHLPLQAVPADCCALLLRIVASFTCCSSVLSDTAICCTCCNWTVSPLVCSLHAAYACIYYLLTNDFVSICMSLNMLLPLLNDGVVQLPPSLLLS